MTDDKIVRHIPKSMVPFAREMGWIEGKDYIIVKPLPYDKARSSRVRIDNVSIKGHGALRAWAQWKLGDPQWAEDFVAFYQNPTEPAG